MRLLVIGRGRMGSLVERLALDQGFTIAGALDRRSGPRAIADGDFAAVDVAIDFTLADAVPQNLRQLAARKINVVIGATGWQAHEDELKAVAAEAGIGVLAASNFSLGMNLFQLIVEEAARRFQPHEDFGAWIHESHHVKKKDAPSGTALTIRAGMVRAGYARAIDVSATRAGHIPGTHAVGFDGASETIELTHTVRDRAVFARGALEAAKWLAGRRGWFSMRDMVMETGAGSREPGTGNSGGR
jgi:4-hydroxy-tetrahydrodipicolinate reductase